MIQADTAKLHAGGQTDAFLAHLAIVIKDRGRESRMPQVICEKVACKEDHPLVQKKTAMPCGVAGE